MVAFSEHFQHGQNISIRGTQHGQCWDLFLFVPILNWKSHNFQCLHFRVSFSRLLDQRTCNWHCLRRVADRERAVDAISFATAQVTCSSTERLWQPFYAVSASTEQTKRGSRITISMGSTFTHRRTYTLRGFFHQKPQQCGAFSGGWVQEKTDKTQNECIKVARGRKHIPFVVIRFCSRSLKLCSCVWNSGS